MYPSWMRDAWDMEPWMEAMMGSPGTADARRKPRRLMTEDAHRRQRMAMANPMTRPKRGAIAAASAAKGHGG